jgi:hypothetical protein
MLSLKVIAWACIVFFMFCAVMAWKAGQGNVAPVFLFFVVLGLLLLATASHLKLTEEAVSVYSPFSEYRLEWHEIDWIEIGTQGTLVLHGKGGERLIMPPVSFWSGEQKPRAYEFMEDKIDALDVVVVPSNTADYKIHKKVKVKNA